MLDVLASERHYIDHLAPVWHALAPEQRGAFSVPPPLADHARRLSIVPSPLAEPRAILVASYIDHKRARRMGRKRIARMEHGIGQSYIGVTAGNYAGGRDCADVSLWLCPNDYSASLWATAYPHAETAIVGSPKLDMLRHQRPPFQSSPTIAVSWHFNYGIVPEAMGTFGYYQKALPELVKHYRVIGHGHPRLFRSLVPQYTRMGIEPVEDLADVLSQVDLYVCDNSSSLYEAATLMPVVVLNGPRYRRNVNHGLRFWQAADVGVQVNTLDELLPAVAEALADAQERRRAREAALDVVYAYRDGKAAQRAALALTEWLGASMAVAA